MAAHKASAGSEPPDGRALERSIVDAATGSYAIPAPHDWRATEGPWKAGTIGLAAIADVPRVAILHGRIQPAFVPLEGDQWLGIAGAAVVATALALLPAAIGYVDDQLSDLPRDGRIDDGKEVERETAARFSSGARAFFAARTMVQPRSKPRTSHASPTPGRRRLPPLHRRPCVRRGRPSRALPRPRRRRPEASPRRGSRTSVRPSPLSHLSTRTRIRARLVNNTCFNHNGPLRPESRSAGNRNH